MSQPKYTGWIDDKPDRLKLERELKYPYFSKAASHLKGDGKGKVSLPFKNAQKFVPSFGQDENQVTGDCCSHGTRNSCDITRASEIIAGEKESFIVRSATEAIYGSRGHTGEGMSGSQCVRFITSEGGIILRQNHIDLNLDLSKYNAKIGMDWGGRGVPSNVLTKCRLHQIQTASLVKTPEECRDALFNGYGINVCCDVGFANVRDKNGIVNPEGSWNHSQTVGACDDSREVLNEMLFLIINSWGPSWITGPKRLGQPEGSYWIRESVMGRMLSQGETYAYSTFNGFPAQKIVYTISEVF